jgi:hypothetical protein
MQAAVKTDVTNLSQVLGSDTDCAARLSAMWEAADIHPHYPATTATVTELLRSGGGFDVTEQLLEDWARRGMVPDVVVRSSRYAWSPTNILTAAVQCDTWRRFIPLDPKHIHKLTGVELAEAQARAAGETAFDDLEMFDVNAFVQILARCDDRQVRETFAVALQTKLRSLGVLDK